MRRIPRHSPTFALAFFAALALALLFSALARAEGGTAVGWGADEFGQIGNPGAAPAEVCKCVEGAVAVAGLSGVTQIAPGDSYTLALLGTGTVMAWGGNASGELGDGTVEPRSSPVPVQALSGVVAVAAGDNHSLALLSNGTVMAWGDNVNGELGNGTVGGSSVLPVAVPGLEHVVAIGAGFRYSLALLADGTVMAWGYDSNNQVGSPPQPECLCVPTATAVPGVSGAVAISAGSDYGAALLSNGSAVAWGFDHSGELGNGAQPPEPCSCFGPLPVANLAGASSISAGGAHTLALAGGGIQAWGLNKEGQLGNGAPPPGGCECVPTPAPTVGPAHPRQVSAGGSHSLALLSNGAVAAWGGNAKGQLGIHSSGGSSAAPVAVGGVSGASAVYAGGGDSFALIGPSQKLTVTLAGSGKGAVGGPGILCPAACSGAFPQGQVEMLRAQPGSGKANAFAGFSGACRGTGPCQVKLGADSAVTATFGRPKGTRILKAKIVAARGSATFRFAAPGAITSYQCQLVKPHRRFTKCRSPIQYKHLKPGRYTFRVRALDVFGPDPKPAVRQFKIR